MAMDVTIRQLEAFQAVVEDEHFARAAQRLNVSAPWLSQNIKELERRVGAPLLVRTTRTVCLTETGRLLASLITPVVADLENALRAARRLAAGETGIRLGYTIGAGLDMVPRLLRTFTARHGHIQVSSTEYDFSDPTAGLRDHSEQAAVVRPPLGLPGLGSIDLLQERRVACLPEGHPLASRKELCVADILPEPIIAAPPSPGPWRDYWTLAEHRVGAAPVVAEASTFDAELHLVARGVGISVTAMAAARWYARPGVVFVPVADLAPCHVSLAWWPQDTGLVADLVEVAHDVIASVGDGAGTGRP